MQAVLKGPQTLVIPTGQNLTVCPLHIGHVNINRLLLANPI